MEINLHKVPVEERQVLEHLIEYYVYDFSEYLDIELSENGNFGFYSLDTYWNDPVNHSPFIVKLNDTIIGFVLVKRVEKNGERINKIAEFFITKKHRRNGYGKLAAKQVFDMYRGSWEVTQIEKNIPAQVFWGHVISDYTSNTYEEHFYDGKYHQTFVNN